MVSIIVEGQDLADTLVVDTLPSNAEIVDSIIPSDDFAIDLKVNYFGKDSTVLDLAAEKIYIYGVDSYVKYGELEVKAGQIEFSFLDFTAFAKGIIDTSGKVVGKPVFIQGDSQFEEDSLGYNFKTKKGISYGVRTQESDAWLLSEVSKKQGNGWIDIKKGKFTTCDNPNPHYYFYLKKAIVVPDEKVVSGPLFMKVRKVPTPLALPFGFFPNKRESSQGILLPGYGNGAKKGFFIQNLGYYIPIQPYLETKLLFDIYTRGSWSIRNITNYKKRYRFSGGFNVSRTVNKSGTPGLSSYFQQNTFNVQWNHQQDPKSRPNSRFNASVNLGSSQNFRNNLNSTQQDFLSSTFTSSLQYGRTFAGTPFTLALEARHTQNVQTRQVDATFPSLVVNMQRLNFFKNVFPNSPIGVNGSLNVSNTLSAKEYQIQLNNLGKLNGLMRNGARVTTNVSTSWKFGPYVTLNPSFNANGFLALKGISSVLDPDLNRTVLDTTAKTLTAGTWNASMSMNTRLYGTWVSKQNGYLKAVRHLIQPSAGVSYTPYQQFLNYGFYGPKGEFLGYNPWGMSAFQPSFTGQSGSINLSITQNIEAKVRDTRSAKVAYKKVKLLESLKTSTSYNMLADSIRLNNLSISAFTTVAKNVTLNYSSTHSFYDRDTLGRDVNKYLLSTGNRLTRLEGANLALSFRFQSRQGSKKKEEEDPSLGVFNQGQQQIIGQNQQSFVDFSMPWTFNLNYNLRLNKSWEQATLRDKSDITQAITFNGDVTILKRWALTANSGYDFKTGKFTTTNLGFHWDLHCWEFSASVVPFGLRKSYFVQLNIKSSMLKDLKLQKRGNLGEPTLLY